MQLGIAQAKARLSELTALVDAGHEVVIAKHGRPSYRLLPVVGGAGQNQALPEAAPGGLDDMAQFLAQSRSKTSAPQSAVKPTAKSTAKLATKTAAKAPISFVEQWRSQARY